MNSRYRPNLHYYWKHENTQYCSTGFYMSNQLPFFREELCAYLHPEPVAHQDRCVRRAASWSGCCCFQLHSRHLCPQLSALHPVWWQRWLQSPWKHPEMVTWRNDGLNSIKRNMSNTFKPCVFQHHELWERCCCGSVPACGGATGSHRILHHAGKSWAKSSSLCHKSTTSWF